MKYMFTNVHKGSFCYSSSEWVRHIPISGMSGLSIDLQIFRKWLYVFFTRKTEWMFKEDGTVSIGEPSAMYQRFRDSTGTSVCIANAYGDTLAGRHKQPDGTYWSFSSVIDFGPDHFFSAIERQANS